MFTCIGNIGISTFGFHSQKLSSLHILGILRPSFQAIAPCLCWKKSLGNVWVVQPRCFKQWRWLVVLLQSSRNPQAGLRPSNSDRAWDIDVSKNRGNRKWMVYNGEPYQNGWFGGKTLFSETSISTNQCYIWSSRACNGSTLSMATWTNQILTIWCSGCPSLIDISTCGNETPDLWMGSFIRIAEPWNMIFPLVTGILHKQIYVWKRAPKQSNFQQRANCVEETWRKNIRDSVAGYTLEV